MRLRSEVERARGGHELYFTFFKSTFQQKTFKEKEFTKERDAIFSLYKNFCFVRGLVARQFLQK
jgi:hypothetical protein